MIVCNENTFCSLIEVVKGENGENKFKCWNHVGMLLGIYTIEELVEREKKYHLTRFSKNKNFIYDRKNQVLKLKPINTKETDTAIGCRDNHERYMRKVKDDKDYMQGVVSVSMDDWNIEAGEELVNVYGLREDVWDKVLDHIQFKTRNIVKKMEEQRAWAGIFDDLI